MKSSFYIHLTVSFLIIILSLSCKKESGDGTGIEEAIHFRYKAEKGTEHKNYSDVVIEPNIINDSTFNVVRQLDDIGVTYCFSYPKDSSVMVSPGNIKRYPITYFRNNNVPFQFSMILPYSDGDSRFMVSSESWESHTYNEVRSITYIGRESGMPVFKIKCSYGLRAYEETSSLSKLVIGTYHLKVKTSVN